MHTQDNLELLEHPNSLFSTNYIAENSYYTKRNGMKLK